MQKVGLVGCGKIAQIRHLPEYEQNPMAEITACCDHNFARAQDMARRYGGAAYRDFDEILADQTVTAISICVANAQHADYAIRALKAGKHVLCEKPMATSEAECRRMLKMARQSGKRLLIGHNQRLNATHQEARKLIAGGEIGRVLSFTSRFMHAGPETWSIDAGNTTWFFDTKQAAMGALADLGIHKVDLIHFLLQDTIEALSATIGTLDKKDSNGQLISVDDNAIFLCQLKGGAIGTITASWTNYGPEENATVIYGTEGVLHLYDDPTYSMRLFRRNGEIISYQIDQMQTNACQPKSGVIDEFIAALEEKRASVLDAENIFPAMRAVFAARQAAERGCRQRIDEETR